MKEGEVLDAWDLQNRANQRFDEALLRRLKKSGRMPTIEERELQKKLGDVAYELKEQRRKEVMAVYEEVQKHPPNVPHTTALDDLEKFLRQAK